MHSIDRQLPLTTHLIFTVNGNNEKVFHGNSNSLSRNNFIFETDTTLQTGMLLQIKLDVASSKKVGLQCLAKVVAIRPVVGSNAYQISSAIEEMALKI